MRLAFTVRTPQGRSDLLVSADPRTPLRDLIPGGGIPARLFVAGSQVSTAVSLADAGLRDGVIVGSEPSPPAVPSAAPGKLALLVASGPATGASFTIPARGLTVGRSTLPILGDDEISGRHFHVSVAGGSVSVADAGSTNGTVVSGEPLDGERGLVPGDLIWAGRTAFTVATAPNGDAALSQDEAGQCWYSRAPRLGEAPRAPRIAMPDPPPEPDKAPFPLLAVAAPLLAGVLMALLLRQPEYLAFIALSPVMIIGNTVSDRRRGKHGHRRRLADFEQRRTGALAELAAARQAELSFRRQVHPDPASLLLIASAPSRRLWERQPGDDDFLALRIGTGAIPWSASGAGRTGGDDGAAARKLHDAPVVIALPECGAIGLTGRPADTRALARGMLLSLAVLHSPRDVSVTVLTAPGSESDWGWLRWLPHVRQPDSARCLVRVGNDETSIGLRLDELREALESRRPEPGAGWPQQHQGTVDIVVLDGSYRLRLGFNVGPLLSEGPAAGIYFLCLDERVAQLPPQCRQGIVEVADHHGTAVARVLGPGYEAADVAADVVSPAVCEAAARTMAPIRETDARAGGVSAPPTAVRFLDAAGLEPPEPRRIRAGWASSGRTTQALLGSRADGPFYLDIGQGPHLLVAGTTGSGKSEFLRTLVASLAAANRSDAMNFVLIDYKGGAAFRAFESLPHTVGMLTDLDEFLVERALISLRAELQRRKAVLAEAAQESIHAYWAALPTMPSADPLPRLVIVVDEFASMAEQLPDQLRSLVNIGAQGRSLGIHLVLATQRPAGVVTADLRANMNLRIALRVATPDDSRDVIETADAARIPVDGSAGRAYAWLGGGRPVAFQVASTQGLRPGAAPRHASARVVPLDWAAVGYPLPEAEQAEPNPDDPTDLSVLIAAIGAAAQDEQLALQRSPWRPPLPDIVTLGSVSGLLPRHLATRQESLRFAFALADYPAAQRQPSAVFDVAESGHLLIAGASQSGRSTMLRTIAGSLAACVSPDDVHVYVIDCGGALAALSGLPHCGAVVTSAEPGRVDRLLSRLTGELARRTRILSAEGHSDLAEHRAARPRGGQLPYLLVLVDRYDAFLTALDQIDGGRLVGQLQLLIRDGLAAGIRVIATGDRSLLTGRLSGLVEAKIVLRLADRTDYALTGLNSRAIPAAMPNGRGIRLPGGDLLQVALLSGEPRGAAENRAVRELAERCVPATVRPFRVDALPSTITFEQARQLPGDGPGLLAGVGGDELCQVRLETPALLVIGQPRSGRSTALGVHALSLAEAGMPLIFVTPRRSRLTTEVVPAMSALHLTATDADAASALAAALAAHGPCVIVVDDAELLTDTPLGEQLVSCLRGVRDGGHCVLAATTLDSAGAFRGLIHELAKVKCGLVLEPASTVDAQPLGVRLPMSVLASGQELRAALVRGGIVTPVQVPTLTASPAGQAGTHGPGTRPADLEGKRG